MNTVIQKYDLNFYNRLIRDRSCLVFQSISTHLDGYIFDWVSSVDVTDYIEATNEVVKGTRSPIDHINEAGYRINVNSEITSFYVDENNNLNAPDYSIPTADFILIITAWRDFLVANKR